MSENRKYPKRLWEFIGFDDLDYFDQLSVVNQIPSRISNAKNVPPSITAMLYSSMCRNIESSSTTVQFHNNGDIIEKVSPYSCTAISSSTKSTPIDVSSSDKDDTFLNTHNIHTPTPKQKQHVLTIDLCSEDEDTNMSMEKCFSFPKLVSPYKDDVIREEMNKKRKQRVSEIELEASNFMQRGRESKLRRDNMCVGNECIDKVILHADEVDCSDLHDNMWHNHLGGDVSKYHDYMIHVTEGIPYESTTSHILR